MHVCMANLSLNMQRATIVEYCSQVYGAASAPHFLMNCSVYKTELRAVWIWCPLLGSSTTPKPWQSGDSYRNQQLATLMFKVRNSMVLHSISNLFQSTDDVHNWQVQNYFPPIKSNTNFEKKIYTGVRWLGIVYLVISQSIQYFKTDFKLNESNHNFLVIIFISYGLLEDHSFCFFCIYWYRL
jgi:hypothetical protein